MDQVVECHVDFIEEVLLKASNQSCEVGSIVKSRLDAICKKKRDLLCFDVFAVQEFLLGSFN